VVDDGSTDETGAQVLSVRDPRVRYLSHEKNRGGAAARNTGIQASQAEFVAFLDSDDGWAPEKLEKQLTLLRTKGSDYGFVYAWFIGRNTAGEEIYRMSNSIDGLAVADLIVANCIATFSNVVARRSALVAVGGLDESMRSCQDWDLFVRLNAITKVCCVPEFLVYYLDSRTDKFRISANPTSVILGHRRMLQKMESQFSGISTDVKIASLKGFANVFASAGAVADVLKTGCRIIRLAPSVSNILLLLRTLARMLRSAVRNPG